MKRLCLVLICVIININSFATTWYSSPWSGAYADDIYQWWSNSDGSGSNPWTFYDPSDVFVVQSDMQLYNSWSISGQLQFVNGGITTYGYSPITIDVGSDVSFYNYSYLTSDWSASDITLNVGGNTTMQDNTYMSNVGGGSLMLNAYGNVDMYGSAYIDNQSWGYNYLTISGDLNMHDYSYITITGYGSCYMYLNGNLGVYDGAYFDNWPDYTHIYFTNTSSSLASPQTITWPSWGFSEYTDLTVYSGCTAALNGDLPLPYWAVDEYYSTAGMSVYGTLVFGTNVMSDPSGSNAFLVYSGSSIYTANTSGIDGSAVSFSSYSLAGDANYIFNGSSAQTTGSLLPSTISSGGSVTANNSAGITLSQSTTFNSGSALNMISGRVAIGAGNTLTLNGAVTGHSLTNSFTGSSSSNLTIGSTGSFGTLYLNQTTDNTTNKLGAFTLNRTSGGSVTMGNKMVAQNACNLTAGKLLLNNQTLVMNGSFSGSSTNSIVSTPSSNIIIGGSGALGTLYLDQTTPGTTNALNSFTINRSGGSAVLGGNINVGLSGLSLTNGTLYDNGYLISLTGNIAGTGTHVSTGTGKIYMTTAAGSISGATLGNIELNNAGGFNVFGNLTINGTLTMTSALINLGGYNLTFGPSATITGTFGTGNMIYATGSSQVRKQFTTTGSFLFPIGDYSPAYTPATITFTGGGFAAGAYAGIKVNNVKHPNNANVGNYLRRYWSVVTSGISTPAYSVDATYVPGDVTGAEGSMSAGEYGAHLPWVKFGATNTTTHTLTAGTITDIVADVTGVTTTAPSVSSSPGTSFCLGNSTTINATSGTGDPSLTYSWAPSEGLNVTTGLSVVATPSVTTTYTVTITDGNGFTGTHATTITVNPVPGTITGITNICTGNNAVLSNAVSGGTWSSSDLSVAYIDLSTGTLTGMSTGVATVTYTLPAGCYTTAAVNVDPAVAPVTGTADVCLGLSTTLADATMGGTWSSSDAATASVGMSTGVVSGLTSGAATITYNITPGCYAITPFTVNSLPDAISGLTHVCKDATTTLTDGGSGSWSVDNPGIASIDAGTGDVTGVSPGTATVTYTLPTGCIVAATVTVLPLPDVYTVAGGGNYCSGGTGVHVTQDFSTPGVSYELYKDAVTTGTTVLGSSAGLDFGSQTAAGYYTVKATNTTTGCVNNMGGGATIGIDPLPSAFNVAGGGNYCSGGTGVNVTIDGSDGGVDYQLYHAGVPVGVPQSGTGSSIDFGAQTVSGAYTVKATSTGTGCVADMTGSASVNINPLPTAFAMSGGGNTCFGGSGVNVILNNSQSGVDYQLMNGSASVGTSVAGTGAALNFGPQTAGGIYTVVATNGTTSCVNTMGSATVTVNPLPDAYIITGGGNYCTGGAGVHVGLDYSAPGISYQLMRGGAPVGSPVNGMGSGLDFGLQTVAGTYGVRATNPATTCKNDMTGTVNINVNTPPTAFATTGGGAYCNGGTGVDVGVASSTSGVDYQLYKGSAMVGIPVGGTGSAIHFGLQTASGSYTIIATDATTGCTKNMSGAAIITINPLPVAYNVTGGGNYCAGGAGEHVGISNSTLGIRYQLYKDLLPVGGAINGTGATLDFGLQTTAGNYTVGAMNSTTTCANSMTGSATIAIDALPAVYTMSGGGTYCEGGTGVHVNLTGSATGINYQLFKDGTPVGSPISGSTGSSLDFGLQTAAGSYTAKASSSITGCASDMTGTAHIVSTPGPAAYTVLGGGSICAGGTGSHIRLSGSVSGVAYQLYKGTLPVGTAMPGTGSLLDFGALTVAGTYMVIATSGSTGCSSNMIASANIIVNPAPVPFVTTGGGSFCASGTGVHVGLSSSTMGYNYQLFKGTTAMGSPWGGTGAALDFGVQTEAGNYHVVGINTATGCTGSMTDTVAVIANPAVTPSVMIATSTGDNKTCAGSMTTFTAAAVNGGSAPAYQWTVNGTYVGAGSAYSYIPAEGDIVKTVLTSSAACITAATASNTVTMNVLTYQLPSATITSDKGTEVCNGTPVTYTATPVNGGTAPTYIWLKNNAMAASGTSYTYTPANGDVVEFMLTSNLRCRLQDTAFSTPMVMQVDVPVAPTVSLTSHIGPVVGVGQWDTVKAHVTNGGVLPSYQWYVNGVPIPGETSPVFFSSTIFDEDSVSCVVTTSGPCGGMEGTAGMRLHLRNVGVKQVVTSGSDIKVIPNPSNGAFTIKGSLGTTATEKVQIEVTNMLGQVVYANNAKAQNGNISEQVALSNVAKGTYLVTVRSESANAVFHIVIE